MKNKGMIVFFIVMIYLIILLFNSIGLIFSTDNDSSSSQYKQKLTLESAYDKDKKGQTLTKQEQRELDSYREWEKKTYGNNL